jgi:hypothetical protein
MTGLPGKNKTSFLKDKPLLHGGGFYYSQVSKQPAGKKGIVIVPFMK